jgi:HAD superfamily hydrolase (TIGR01509 family)
LTLQALIWDVDGTIAETERDGHRVAFNRAFAARNLSWHWDEQHYGRLLRVTGGRERLLHDMESRAAAPALRADREALAGAVHVLKNSFYAEIVREGAIALRPGVLQLMQECRAADVRMAIATTTSRANVAALLRAGLGESWPDWFAAVVCAEDVVRKKPDPQVYARACQQLGVPADSAAAIEDSPDGAAAARAAGLHVILTRSFYFPDDTVGAVTACGPGLDQSAGWRPAVPASVPARQGVGLATIEAWCRGESVKPD